MLVGRGAKGHKNCEQTFCEQTGVPYFIAAIRCTHSYRSCARFRVREAATLWIDDSSTIYVPMSEEENWSPIGCTLVFSQPCNRLDLLQSPGTPGLCSRPGRLQSQPQKRIWRGGKARMKIRRTSETPTTTTSLRSIAIHLQFVLQYASYLYCGAPPICIAIRPPFASSYRSFLGKILVVVVTGMFPRNEAKRLASSHLHAVCHLTQNYCITRSWVNGVGRGGGQAAFNNISWNQVQNPVQIP